MSAQTEQVKALQTQLTQAEEAAQKLNAQWLRFEIADEAGEIVYETRSDTDDEIPELLPGLYDITVSGMNAENEALFTFYYTLKIADPAAE